MTGDFTEILSFAVKLCESSVITPTDIEKLAGLLRGKGLNVRTPGSSADLLLRRVASALHWDREKVSDEAIIEAIWLLARYTDADRKARGEDPIKPEDFAKRDANNASQD